MSTCLIALGSNLGDRRQLLDEAVARLGRQAGIELTAQSAWVETHPTGGPPDQPAFLNGAVLVRTSLAPEGLLAALQQIEDLLGRQRSLRWGPRTIDLDLLLYDQLTLAAPGLVVPHPRMAWRRFVLEPAGQIAAHMLHPGTGWTIAQLLENLNRRPRYVAIAGPSPDNKTQLARRVATACGGFVRLIAGPKSPSHDLAAELELLEERGRLLAAEGDCPIFRGHHAEHGRERGTVPFRALTLSDFWFDEGPSFARTRLVAGEAARYDAAWQDLRASVPRPQLIAFLETPGEPLSESILCRALEPDRGPLLRHPGSDLPGAEEEVVAALRAM
jgi:2-amino-4-hydroxy-6-hydroxymethyldihydropteridine diphosphokinase